MKILMVNKFHYLRGGSEKYYFELAELLKEYGHEVAFFSMENEKNIHTNNREYFTKSIDLNNSRSKLKALEIIYSRANKKIMERALEEFKPDIVHLNNFQRQLSASILTPIKKRNIPIVYTAHDLQAICPAILMLDTNKNICEKCINGNYKNCIKNKCIKNSKLKSILGVIEAKYYDNQEIYTKKINTIITPSNFLKNKLIEKGIDSNKIEVINNFINEQEEIEIEERLGDYALYFGRLSVEKGIMNLIEAFKNIDNHKLIIAGTGPEEESIKKIINRNKLESKIELLGFLQKETIKEYIKKARFVIVPSICYDNFPYSILEAQLMGKPVIGAKIGGIPELISNEENGLLYEYNNIKELTEKINILFKDDILLHKLEDNLNKNVEEKYSKQRYYNKIIKIYQNLLLERKTKWQ